jgi:putative restriction endonuclease
MANKPWTRDEFIVTLDLYFRMSYTRFSKTNPDVKKLSQLIGRTPSSASMRLCNYMSCDPELRARNIVGLEAGRKQCMPYWEEFANDKAKLRRAAVQSRQRLIEKVAEENLNVYTTQWDDLSEEMFDTKFQAIVLNNYKSHCAVSGIKVPEVLMGCHIIPFAENEEESMKADNGLCLTVLYAKAYLDGLIGIDQDYKIHISDDLKSHQMERGYAANFKKYDGESLNLRDVTIRPNPDFLKWHMNSVYRM